MIKKIVVILLAIMMITALAACSGADDTPAPVDPPAPTTQPPPPPATDPPPPTTDAPQKDPPGGQTGTPADTLAAYDMYKQIAGHLSLGPGDDGEYDIDFVTDMYLIFGGEDMEISIGGNLKMIVDGNDIQAVMTMDMSMYGMGAMVIYMDGNNVYASIDGMEIDMDLGDFMDMIEDSADMPDFSQDAIKSCDIIKLGGDTIYFIVIDGIAMTEYVAASMQDVMAGADMFGLQMEIADVEMEIVTDSSDNPKSLLMKMHVLMAVEGEEIEMYMNATYIFNKLGSGVVINIPA